MSRSRPYYSFRLIRNCIDSGNYSIKVGARKTAKDDFGWLQADILAAMKQLKLYHYHKTETRYDNPSVYVDYYKARNLRGEDVYIHFRIEDGELIICSFKSI